MTERLIPKQNLGLILVALTIILLLAVLYGRFVRGIYLPESLGYLPEDSNAIISTGPISQLWQGVERHFGDVLREDEREGALASLLMEIRSALDRRHTPISTLADLSRYGVDVTSGVLVGGQIANSVFEGIAVVPVTDSGSFSRFLAGDSEDKDATCALEPGESPSLYDIGELFVAYPLPTLAVLSTSCDRLVSALRHKDRQTEYMRANDSLLRAVRTVHDRPLPTGAGLFAWLGQVPTGAFGQPGVMLYSAAEASISLSIQPESVSLKANLNTGGGGAGLLAKILALPPAEEAWRDQLAGAVPAAAVLHDNALPDYLKIASRFQQVWNLWPRALQPILEEAQHRQSLRQIVLALTGYREGAPQMLVGVWGERSELDHLLTDIQGRLQRERDKAVVQEAADRWHSAHPSRSFPTVAELFAAGFLEPEVDARFSEYAIGENGQIIEPGLTVSHPASAGSIVDGSIHYLAPPVTDNDVNNRRPFRELSERSLALLRGDRFRLPARARGNMVWIGTDEVDFQTMPRGGQASPEDGAMQVISVASPVDPNAKLSLAINMPSLIKEGLLSGDSDIEQLVKTALFDFRYHPSVVIDLATTARGQTLRFVLDARRSTGETP
jgi:hypothetical protein